MLTNKQIAYLKSQAHHLQPVVFVGQQGLSEQVLAKVGAELEAHELIKVKFTAFKDEKRELTEAIVAATGCAQVTIIGNIAVLYRESSDPERRRVLLPA